MNTIYYLIAGGGLFLLALLLLWMTGNKPAFIPDFPIQHTPTKNSQLFITTPGFLRHKPIKVQAPKIKERYTLQVYETLSRTWQPHHSIKASSDLTELDQSAKASLKRMIQQNKRASRDLRPGSYGTFAIPYMRITKNDGTFVQWVNKPTWMKNKGTVDRRYIPKRKIIRNSLRAPKIRFSEGTYGAHSGQVDCIIQAYDEEKKEEAGYLDYSIYRKKAHINHIEIFPGYKRKGLAKKLVKQLNDDFPPDEIEWGMLTTEGAALKRSINRDMSLRK